MTPTLKQLDELEKKATQGEWSSPKPGWQPPVNMGMRSQYPKEGWFPEHIKDYRLNSDALDSEEENGVAYQLDEADAEFIAALVNFWRSKEGRQMREDAERYRWLRSNADEVYCGEPEIEWYVKDGRLPAQLDDAIDAARGEDK
jgi:hypothetical protein